MALQLLLLKDQFHATRRARTPDFHNIEARMLATANFKKNRPLAHSLRAILAIFLIAFRQRPQTIFIHLVCAMSPGLRAPTGEIQRLAVNLFCLYWLESQDMVKS